jgi:hypothetical protein
MKMSSFIEKFAQDLRGLGKLGGADLESAVERLLPAIEPILQSRLLDALSEVAQDIKENLPGGRLEARLNGEEITFAFLPDDEAPRETPTDLNARITLRLPDDLKSRIEQAATREGISLNSWLLKASERGSYSVTFSPGKRQMKGKGRS